MTDSETEIDSITSRKFPLLNGRKGENYGLWRLCLRAPWHVKGFWNAVQPENDDESESSSIISIPIVSLY